MNGDPIWPDRAGGTDSETALRDKAPISELSWSGLVDFRIICLGQFFSKATTQEIDYHYVLEPITAASREGGASVSICEYASDEVRHRAHPWNRLSWEQVIVLKVHEPSEFDPVNSIWLEMPQAPPFGAPNEVEHRVAEAIRKAKDVGCGSEELTQAITDWPSFCLLSDVRANLLRPFADLLRGRILEVGAQCGALTRYLGERLSRRAPGRDCRY